MVPGVIAKHFEVTFRGRIGPARGDLKSIKLFNRVIQWEDKGLVYEADQRHADMIIKMIGLTQDSKPLSSPGEKSDPETMSEPLRSY